MKNKRNRPPKTPVERKQTQRDAERAFLLAQGWDVKRDGAFVTAWRAGKIKVTFEIIKKEGKQ